MGDAAPGRLWSRGQRVQRMGGVRSAVSNIGECVSVPRDRRAAQTSEDRGKGCKPAGRVYRPGRAGEAAIKRKAMAADGASRCRSQHNPPSSRKAAKTGRGSFGSYRRVFEAFEDRYGGVEQPRSCSESYRVVMESGEGAQRRVSNPYTLRRAHKRQRCRMPPHVNKGLPKV